MKSLHYEKDGSLISLDQFKNSLYEPNLLPRILGFIDDPLPNRALGQILPHPEMNITHPNLNDGVLGIEVEDNGGGIGEIVIIINGKEVSRDVRNVSAAESGSVDLQYQISGHPYLKGDGIDRVVIKAYNKDGSMSTSERSISVFPDSKLSQVKPKLYAVIAGTSDYGGEALDLDYAAKDAEDFAKVLELSAINQFGKDEVEIALLTTNNDDLSMWPLKRNLDSVFTAFGEKARAVDYLVVYLSGHGVNDGDFYYLTADASDPVLEDRDKANVAISSLELTSMIQKVPALKQVLVLDACHSGRFANDLIQSESITVMEAERIKAMERMKDRMGMYVLAGSKADAVSYEADLFGQGLLTYSILFGIKGAALENEAVDVIDLFQYVQSKVPELAADIGGIQRPEVRYPANAESFSLGQLSQAERDDIQLVQPKPIFTISSFQDEKQYLDVLQIGKLMDHDLRTLASEEGEIVFVRKSSFSDAYHIKGRYNVTQEKIRIRGRLYKGEERVSDFNREGNDPEGVFAGQLLHMASESSMQDTRKNKDTTIAVKTADLNVNCRIFQFIDPLK
ncbi:unnamed protein product [Symbiodinium microadriaticum]|nr:unnamed protein product [Symbiodinium microadriaticum]